MDPSYKPLQQRADHLEHRIIDWTDDHNNPMCVQMMQTARLATEEFEMNKPPRTIESRILQVQEMLKQRPPMITPEHASTLVNDYEDLRRQVRQLPHY